MLAKLFNFESKSVEAGAYVLAGSGIFGGILGLLRNALLASNFGATRDLDIYFATFRIPDFIYNIFIFGALSAGFMPVFSKWIMMGKDKAWEFVSALMTVFIFLTGFSAIVVFIFAQPLANLIVPGFDEDAVKKVAGLLRILMIQPIILAVSNVVANTLQSFRRFLAYSLAPVMYNVGIIIGIVGFGQVWGIAGVVWGVVLGAVLHLLIQLPSFFALGFNFVPKFRQSLGGLWEVGKLMAPRSLALAINQLNLIFITIVASSLQEGTLVIFNFANDLQGLPQTLLALSFATAAFPAMASFWARGDSENFRRLLQRTLAEIFVWLIPIGLILFAFRQPIVEFTLSYGRFDYLSQTKTASALAIFLLGLPFQGALLLLVRTFFAMGESRLPLLTAVASAILVVFTAVYLGRLWDVVGLSAALVIASIFHAGLLFVILRKKLKGIDGLPVFKLALRSSILGASAASSGWLAYYLAGFFLQEPTFINQILRLAVAALPIALVFFVGVFMFKLLDISQFVREVEQKENVAAES